MLMAEHTGLKLNLRQWGDEMRLINGQPITDDDFSSLASDIAAVEANVDVLEDHFHCIERWYGKSAAFTEVDAADNRLVPFQIDSGNNAYGTAICILGSGDTPFQAGKTYFDLHKLLIVATERANEVYKIRLTWGASEAAGIAAGNYSTTMIYPSATLRQTPQEIRMPRIAAGTKVWVNCWCASNTGTIDFYIGLHEYDE